MRDPLAPIINDVDFSGFVNRYSFECEPFFTDANDSQTMLDGSTIRNVFPLKARFSWTLNALSAEQYAALNAAFARDTVLAQIFDPTVNAARSAQFHVTRPTFVYNLTTQHYMSSAGSALILEDAAPRALSAVTLSPRPIDAARDPLAPVIDGYDLSGIVNRFSLQVEPYTTDGDNAGTLQDGSTVLDVLANKFRLSWTLNAISARQYADLCAVLSSGTDPDTVAASVYNPILNAGYTTLFHVTLPVFRFALDNGQCMAFADGALVLEETRKERGLPVAGDDDWRLYDNGTIEIDPLPDGSPETEDDRWRRILQDIDTPSGDPNTPIHDVDRIKLNPNVPSLPSGVPEEFPNLDEIVIPPNIEIPSDEFDNCPNLTIIKIVSFPYRADYVTGDALDYNGLHVVKISGDTERDITPECVLRPAEGYVTNVVEDIMVDVRYHDKSLGTFWVQVTASLDLSYIYIQTYPKKRNYDFGQTLDYTGIVVSGVHPDGTTTDVTSFCTFSPKIDEAIPTPDIENPDLNDYRDLPVSVQCGQYTTSFNVGGPAKAQRRAAGTSRLYSIPEGNFDTFVGRFSFWNNNKNAPPRVFRWVEFEYKLPGADTYERETHYIEVTAEKQTIYHVVQIPEGVPLQDVSYNIYMYEPGFTGSESKERIISWDSYFMMFPYYPESGKEYIYPGSPELVNAWFIRTYR